MSIQVAILTSMLASSHPASENVQLAFDRWEQRLRSKVAELHEVPASAARDAACDVMISFSIDRDGRPANAGIKESNCKRFYERSSLRLVRNLGGIGPVPSANDTDHKVLLKLSYGVADTAEADRRLSEQLEAERQASAGRNLRIIFKPIHTARAD